MAAQCPNCGSRYLRESQRPDEGRKPSAWKFEKSLRCLDCKTRFIGQTLTWDDVKFAHCPNCDRMDLNSWTGKNYIPPFWVRMKIRFGAKRWRCEYCRINFASFRQRKEVFTFKRWANMNVTSAVAQGRARVAEMEARQIAERELAEQQEREAQRLAQQRKRAQSAGE